MEKKIQFLDNVQYVIALAIAILFLLGLIPLTFDDIYPLLILLVIIQLAISLIRLRFLNVILEVFIIGVALLSLIPLLGFPFRIIGFLLGLLEVVSFKNNSLYVQAENRTFKKKKKKVKAKPKFQEADFKEK